MIHYNEINCISFLVSCAYPLIAALSIYAPIAPSLPLALSFCLHCICQLTWTVQTTGVLGGQHLSHAWLRLAATQRCLSIGWAWSIYVAPPESQESKSWGYLFTIHLSACVLTYLSYRLRMFFWHLYARNFPAIKFAMPKTTEINNEKIK